MECTPWLPDWAWVALDLDAMTLAAAAAPLKHPTKKLEALPGVLLNMFPVSPSCQSESRGRILRPARSCLGCTTQGPHTSTKPGETARRGSWHENQNASASAAVTLIG